MQKLPAIHCRPRAARQGERGGAAGYTLRELCQLARSSLPAQRAAACRHLEAVLLRARPSAFDRLLTGEPRPRPVAMPAPAPVRLCVYRCLNLPTLLHHGCDAY